MQPYREATTAPALETIFAAPAPISYYVFAAVGAFLAVAAIVRSPSETGAWVAGAISFAFGVLFLLLGLRKRATRVTVGASGFRVMGEGALEHRWREVEAIRIETQAVGYAREVSVRTVTLRDGQAVSLPSWLDADFDAVFDRAFKAARLAAASKPDAPKATAGQDATEDAAADEAEDGTGEERLLRSR